MAFRGYKSTFNRRNANGEEEIVELDENGDEIVLKTSETPHSKIKKATLNSLEDLRDLLLELFP